MAYNWCQRVHDCVAVSFSFLTNANLGLLSTEIASTIHLSLYAMWAWLKTEGTHVPSPPSSPPPLLPLLLTPMLMCHTPKRNEVTKQG